MKISKHNKEESLFRIKQLIEKTGVSRETIHFYLTEGLLPEPNKKTKNMSWYSQEHIERLNLIKELQEKQFLPLKVIKAILTNAEDFNFTPDQKKLIHYMQNDFLEKQEKCISINEIVRDQNISLDEINKMKSIGYIDNTKYLTNEDLKLIELWITLKEMGITEDLGFPLSNLDFFIDISEIIFNQEFSIFSENLSNLTNEQITNIVQNSIPVINNIISVLHQKRVHKFINDFKIY